MMCYSLNVHFQGQRVNAVLENVAVYFKSHMGRVNSLCLQNSEILILERMVRLIATLLRYHMDRDV